jgi:hypothetical protein
MSTFDYCGTVNFSFRLRHSIQSKGSIWKWRGGSPALGIGLEEAGRFIRLVLEKAGLPPLNVLLKLLNERRWKSQ